MSNMKHHQFQVNAFNFCSSTCVSISLSVLHTYFALKYSTVNSTFRFQYFMQVSFIYFWHNTLRTEYRKENHLCSFSD